MRREYAARLKACEQRIQARKQRKEERAKALAPYVRDIGQEQALQLKFSITASWSPADKLMAVQCWHNDRVRE